jgi:hypothetical protein
MDKFLSRIDRQYKLLREEDEELPGGEADAPEVPEAPVPEEPESELPGEDDTSKLKVDYVEMIRKALIMAPKHIDDVDYARLTKIVDTENLEEMQELVSRIVRNNYPHPDL